VVVFCSDSVSSSEEVVDKVNKEEDDDESEDSFTLSPIEPLLLGLFSTGSDTAPIFSLPFPDHFSSACEYKF
jgi:hypothetical protein